MKVETLINQSLKDFKNLSEQELTKQINYLNKYANQRIDRLKKNNITNRATAKLQQMGIDKFKLKRGATEEEKRQHFIKLKNFLSEKSSTISGHQEQRKNVREGLKTRGIEITEKNQDRFFKIYDKLAEEKEMTNEMRYEVMSEISTAINMLGGKLSDDTIINMIQKNYNQIYKNKEMQKMNDDFFGKFGVEKGFKKYKRGEQIEEPPKRKKISAEEMFKNQRRRERQKNKHRKK